MTEGTRVFSGEVFNLAATMDKIEQINKRAADKDLNGGYTFEIEKVTEPNEYGFMVDHFYLHVTGSAPKLNGRTLVALVTWEGDSPIVDTIPGYTGPMVDRTTLDGHCDICGWKRERNHVIVCEHPTEGRKVVGGQCVKDLLGHQISPTAWPSIPEDGDEEWGLSSGSRGDHTVNTQHVVCAAIAATTVWGWVPKSAAEGVPTAAFVEDEIVGEGWEKAAAKTTSGVMWTNYTNALEIAYSDDTKATAAQVIEWAKNLPPTSEFNQNLAAVAASEQVDEKRIGILTYAFTGWLKAQEWAAAKKAEAATVVNEPLAETKARVKDVPATITGIKYIDGFYGVTTLVKFLTDDGHKAAWFASNTSIDESWIGTKVLVTGTVKGAKEWDGYCETQLTRCKVGKANT